VHSRIDFHDKNLLQRGFTLIELLVVIVILGVLAAVVVFAVGGITSKGKASSCTIEVRTVNTALQAYYAKTDPSVYPPAGTAASMMAVLKGAGLLQQAAPGATATFTPLYDGAGNFSATCPAN